MTRKAICFVALCLAPLAACSKKPASAAPAAEAVKALPPGAKAYVEIDVKAVLGLPVLASLKSAAMEDAPPSCVPMLDAITTVSAAGYGEGMDALFFMPRGVKAYDGGEAEIPPPPPMVAIVNGPTAAAMKACFEDATRKDEAATRTETRNGREVLIGGRDQQTAMFSISDTSHVCATLPMLDAAIAASSGGPALAGAPVLSALSAVPTGSILVSVELPRELAAEMAAGLKMLSGGKDVPPPRAVAGSIGLGDTLALAAAITMGDEASARTLHEAGSAALSLAKGMLLAAGDDPMMTRIKALVDTVAISLGGASVSVRASLPADLIADMLFRGSESREVPASEIEPDESGRVAPPTAEPPAGP